jgi:hypothetical protein
MEPTNVRGIFGNNAERLGPDQSVLLSPTMVSGSIVRSSLLASSAIR